MADENINTVNSSLDDNRRLLIKINQQIRFTLVQIEKLLKLRLLNMNTPQKCIS